MYRIWFSRVELLPQKVWGGRLLVPRRKCTLPVGPGVRSHCCRFTSAVVGHGDQFVCGPAIDSCTSQKPIASSVRACVNWDTISRSRKTRRQWQLSPNFATFFLLFLCVQLSPPSYPLTARSCIFIASDKGGGEIFLPVFVCLSVCLSVSKITQKRVRRFG